MRVCEPSVSCTVHLGHLTLTLTVTDPDPNPDPDPDLFVYAFLSMRIAQIAKAQVKDGVRILQ